MEVLQIVDYLIHRPASAFSAPRDEPLSVVLGIDFGSLGVLGEFGKMAVDVGRRAGAEVDCGEGVVDGPTVEGFVGWGVG